jgi:bacterioferritin (cytochrome b1)
MSGSDTRPGFAARPSAAERWVKTPEIARPPSADQYTARLTIDVTPELRRRLKLVALQRGQTVADMLRALFEREFPHGQGDAP